MNRRVYQKIRQCYSCKPGGLNHVSSTLISRDLSSLEGNRREMLNFGVNSGHEARVTHQIATIMNRRISINAHASIALSYPL